MSPAKYLLVLFAWLAPLAALSDPQSKSWSSWTLGNALIEMHYTIPLRDAAALGGGDNAAAMLQGELDTKVALRRADQPCTRTALRQARARDGYLRFQLSWSCADSKADWHITQTAMFDTVPGHIHFARFEFADKPTAERLFTRHAQQHTLPTGTAAATTVTGNVWKTYTLFGFEHILVGVDHIAFLLGLILLTRRAIDVLLIVTGFTLGHSVTLALTVLGLVTPEQTLVEGLIGFTIALVALENVLDTPSDHRRAGLACLMLFSVLALASLAAGAGPPALTLFGLGLFTLCYLQLSDNPRESQRLRPFLTLLFGLIHGFGFASVLIEVGLPADRLIASLLAFNIGVELGQIAIVLVLASLAFATHKLTARRSTIETTINAALCGLGVFWFIARLY